MSDGEPTPAASPEALARLRALYADLERELSAIAPRCELSGRCCDFRRAGHTLFATDLEIAHLAATTPWRADGERDLCPWWIGGRCEARDGRPLGCRIYFCDPTKQEALELVSQRFHERLRRLHDECDVAYRYAPFVARVRGLASPAPRDRGNAGEMAPPQR